MTELRYDPSRLAPLRSCAAAAFRHLLMTSSADPAAASALRVSRSVLAGLEHGWLPAIDRVLSSHAMLTWLATGPAWMLGVSGDDLGRALVARAEALYSDSRDEPVAEMLAAITLAAGDQEAMNTFFRELGPDGLLMLLASLATANPNDTELPAAVRAALTATAARGGLRPGYARDLVEAAARTQEQSRHDGEDAVALSYLLHGDQLPATFLVEAAEAMIEAEARFAAAEGLDPSSGWTLWMLEGFRIPNALALDFTDSRGMTAAAAADPMYALLAQLANDGRAGQIVFRDPERAVYLFALRDVLADGGDAIVTAAAAAAAGPDVVDGAPDYVLADASLVASGFVNYFGRTNAGRADSSDAVTIGTARIVGAHMYAVDATVAAHDVGDDERIANLTDAERRALEEAGLLDEDGELRDGAVMATGELYHDVLGPEDPRRAAVLQHEPLENILGLAAGTDASSVLLRDALATYQRGLASAAAGRLAAEDVTDPNDYLAEVMADAARLEGTFARHVGHAAERRGRDADAAMGFWINAVGMGAERLGSTLGKPGSTVVGHLTDPAADLATDAFADAEREAEAEADELARLAGEQLAYVWFRELHNAGVIDADLPTDLAPGGTLPSYAELVRRVYERPDWTIERVFNALDVARSDAGVDLDSQALRDALAVAQLPAYHDLD